MKFALRADQRIEATPNALGVCPCCGTEMIAKCGNRKVWHWAHKTKQTCLHRRADVRARGENEVCSQHCRGKSRGKLNTNKIN